MKLIEENENYKIYEFCFPKCKQVIKLWYNGVNEMKFDEEFVKANGYKNIEDFINKMPGAKEKLIKIYGRIPEWISIDLSSGKIWFPVLNNLNNEHIN